MSDYIPQKIEEKWQKYWEENGFFDYSSTSNKPKYYMLTMLPYPSGDLHIGHWYAMAPSDTYARFKKMQGFEVFFPIGFDSFGLPAENAAIKNNIHPKHWTYKNIERMQKQLRTMGNMFAWKNEVITCDPEYYKWSQWFFLKMMEEDLAYREHAPVDFCTNCQTTLAREQVWGEDRICERCQNPVIKKKLNQWKLRITKYADELLNFKDLDWPERVCTMQENWIGRSEGVEFSLKVFDQNNLDFRVFTTRPDTVFGMTFCVLAPEHELVEKITTPEQLNDVNSYVKEASRKNEIERTSEKLEKDGVFTGAYALNPLNNEKVPIWIADYVLASYGTGAIMAVPGHDERDFNFARKYNLPIKVVIVHESQKNSIPKSPDIEGPILQKENSIMVNSSYFDGHVWPKSFKIIAEKMEAMGIGERQVNYRLRDWLISRQRMWGTPIPVVYCKSCGMNPVPYEQLPVLLPDDAEFKPTGESPLKYHKDFLKTTCPNCGKEAKRETDTMDTFICSSWYYYAYLSPYWKKGEKITKKDFPWDIKKINDLCPVDQYTGGIEHATMHLLYFRFFTKALADIGIIDFREPTKKLFNQGMILGEDHEKMSKSRGNVVNPDDLVKKYGTDTVRAYLMFLGPWDAGAPWNPHGIEGLARFFKGVWSLCHLKIKKDIKQNKNLEKQLIKSLNQTIKKTKEDYESFRFNTAIAAMMSFRNTLKTSSEAAGTNVWKECLEKLLLILAPVAPHLTEELWNKIKPNEGSIHIQEWPEYDQELANEEKITLVIQVNGKVRDKFEMLKGTGKFESEKKALESSKVIPYIKDKKIHKVIFVPDRLVNIVCN